MHMCDAEGVPIDFWSKLRNEHCVRSRTHFSRIFDLVYAYERLYRFQIHVIYISRLSPNYVRNVHSFFFKSFLSYIYYSLNFL